MNQEDIIKEKIKECCINGSLSIKDVEYLVEVYILEIKNRIIKTNFGFYLDHNAINTILSVIIDHYLLKFSACVLKNKENKILNIYFEH